MRDILKMLYLQCVKLNMAKNKTKSIGDQIKIAREEASYPQAELAKDLGFETAAAVSLIENGERKISAEKLAKIAKVLNKDISFFLGAEKEMPDVKVALRADKSISEKDKEAILHFIDLAKDKGKKRYGN